MLRIFIPTFVLLVSQNVVAASGAIPMGTVISQIVNLSLLIAIIYFTQKKNISKLFAEKRAAYLSHVEEAAASKKAAETKLAEVTARLNGIEQNYHVQIADAKKQAEESYRDQLAQAKNEGERLKAGSQNNLEFEIQKQVENLRVETFKKSVDHAEKKLETELTAEQLQSWNGHFISGQQGAH